MTTINFVSNNSTVSYKGTLMAAPVVTGTSLRSGVYISSSPTPNSHYGNFLVHQWFIGPPASTIRGKYSVRCAGCGRWAKVVREINGRTVECVRCLGEMKGVLK